MVINMIFPQQGKSVAGVGTPPASERICPMWKTKATTDPMSAGVQWDESGSVPRYRSKRGTEFDENGPNLTEDVIFAIGTTLVGIEGPDEVQSSGIESKAARGRM